MTGEITGMRPVSLTLSYDIDGGRSTEFAHSLLLVHLESKRDRHAEVEGKTAVILVLW